MRHRQREPRPAWRHGYPLVYRLRPEKLEGNPGKPQDAEAARRGAGRVFKSRRLPTLAGPEQFRLPASSLIRK